MYFMLGDHKHISIESYVRDRHIVCFLCVVVPESHFDLLSVPSTTDHDAAVSTTITFTLSVLPG